MLNLNNEIIIRKKKLSELRKNGLAFPNNFRRNAISSQLHYLYGNKSNNDLLSLNVKVSVAGRMISRRIMGKASFITIQDMGGKLQVYIVQNNLPDGYYINHFKQWDLGDILGIHGKLFKTKIGELSVRCNEIYLLTKAIRPLPSKFHGLIDREIRYRQRYLDLITNEKSRQIFKIRSLIIKEIRHFMANNDFIEVETPMIQNIPGGASARPFVTYHNAMNTDMYLRVAPELYLKKLVVGGFEKIFEINRSFRNEGISPIHNAEFTMMELYMAYSDYKDLISLVENLFHSLTKQVLGTNIVEYGNYVFDFSKPFCKMNIKEAICKFCKKIRLRDLEDLNSINNIVNSLGIEISKNFSLGQIQFKIFEEIVEKQLIQPTFITSYPIEISPLARSNDQNPSFADRFELFIAGHEIGNGFSELNDPEDQSMRFIEQIENKYLNKKENMFYDKDYITALEYGLPPTAGLGLGIDRIIMLLTNSHSIRDVILFPMVRQKCTYNK